MSHARDVSKFVNFITDDYRVSTSVIDSDIVASSSTKSLEVKTGIGTKGYATPDDLPANAPVGSQGFVTSNNRLYISNGTGWYNIALINRTPYWITQPDGSYALDTTGQATVITILGGDSDGYDVPQYIVSSDSGFDTIATVTKDSDNGRVFIVRAIDSEGTGNTVSGSGTLTFTLSDGKQSVLANSSFTIDIGIVWTTQDIYNPASDPTTNNKFGSAAVISNDGKWLVAASGAPFTNTNNDNHIRVWLFKDSDGWDLKRIIGGNGNAQQANTYSMKISDDNRYIAHGWPAFNQSYGGYIDVAHDAVLTDWGSEGQAFATVRIYPPVSYQNTDGNKFGWAVDMDSKGEYILTGADGANTSKGRAFLYKRTSTSGSYTLTYDLVADFVAPSISAYNRFGSNLSMSGSGRYFAIGASGATPLYPNDGSVHIYDLRSSVWNSSTANWYTKISSPVSGLQYFNFGSEVSLDSDGVYAAIGAQNWQDSDGRYRGAVYIYKRSGSTTWTQQQFITEPTVPVASTGQGFGASIQLSRDGTFLTILASAERDSENSSLNQGGAVYVYQRNGETWEQTNRLVSDTSSSTYFGSAAYGGLITISGDNKKIAIPQYTYSSDSGRVVIHTRS